MLKTTKSTGSATNPKKTNNEVDGNIAARGSIVGGGEAINQINPTKKEKQVKITKFKNLIKSKNHDFPPNSRNREVKTGFFIPKARLAFIHLRQAFIEALILYHFDPKCYIRIETNISGYAIGEILS